MNEIGKFLSKAAEKAGIQVPGSNISNPHTARKTCISMLLDANTPTRELCGSIERTQKH